ncbi:MAG TPA: hypothetical protein VIK86_00220 [Candidatus Paceibacterota bacterium]
MKDISIIIESLEEIGTESEGILKEIELHNTGIIIPKEILSRIFKFIKTGTEVEQRKIAEGLIDIDNCSILAETLNNITLQLANNSKIYGKDLNFLKRYIIDNFILTTKNSSNFNEKDTTESYFLLSCKQRLWIIEFNYKVIDVTEEMEIK